MTENKGSSQPNKGKNGKSKSKKNKNVKRTIIKIIGFLFMPLSCYFYSVYFYLHTMLGKLQHLMSLN
ncbi:hypothetical protein, partial [Serratia marcescens]|uniref:hypothetical protein n=1 Tax=Serratia marcescens TaxID=615 RepID=UPI001954E443